MQLRLALGLVCLAVPSPAADGQAAMARVVDLSVYPAEIVLDGRDASPDRRGDGRGCQRRGVGSSPIRLRPRLRDGDIARLDEGGALVVRGVEDGTTQLMASYGGLSTQATVRVKPTPDCLRS